MCTSYALFFLTLLFLSDILLLGAMKDNIDLVKRGILVLLPELDDRGRSIIYANLSLRGDGDPDKVCVFWTLLCWFALYSICNNQISPVSNILLGDPIVVVFDTCCNGETKLSEGEFGEFKVLHYHFVCAVVSDI